MKCRFCENDIINFFSLGQMPLVNSLLTKEQIPLEKKYDLSLGFCKKCYLVQLTKNINPDKLFSNYVYFSSTSQSFLEHSRKTASSLIKKLHLNKKSLVVEIASNDGAQLQYFKKLGIPILGIDPAKNIAKVANDKGIRTIPEFFNYKFARKLNKKGVRADLIFGANVLAHVPTIGDFISGLKEILKSHGTAVFEFPYIAGLFENKFDTIYHEHVFYYSLIALKNLFTSQGMQIYDLEFTKTQGGSLRVYVSHNNSFKVTRKVADLLNTEEERGYDTIGTYKKIKSNVEILRRELIGVLTKIKKGNATIAAYSAPAKGLILLNYFGISTNYLDFIVDKSPAKQGFYTPGTHMMVFPPREVLERSPDYLLILCWNIADEVMEQMKDYIKSGGKFIIPIPRVKIL